MLSVCGVGGGGVELLLPPPQPAIPAARHTTSSMVAQAYASLLGRDATCSLRRLSRRVANSSPATMLIGPEGLTGPKGGRREMFVGPAGGAKSANVVVSVAVHVPGVEAVAAVGVHIAGDS